MRGYSLWAACCCVCICSCFKQIKEIQNNPTSQRLVFTSVKHQTWSYICLKMKCFWFSMYIHLPAACRFTSADASFSSGYTSIEPPLWHLIGSAEVWDGAVRSSANFFPTQTCRVCHSRARHLISAKWGLKIMALELFEVRNYQTQTGSKG